MRRKEKEITDRREIDEILTEARICHIAFARDDEPYLLPLFFGYDGNCLYFHTAKQGRKLEFLAANPRVCFEVERDVEIVARDQACNWSACFESVIGCGHVAELVGNEEKQAGMDQIMRHYSDREWAYDPSLLAVTRVWRLEIAALTGKRSRVTPEPR
jgi:nitroimidazol reductase NimA-like FMN-containing flavoprotein (pyridoxamine 5'-phosphate oxidase superfamily)